MAKQTTVEISEALTVNNKPELDRCAVIEAGFYAFALCCLAVMVAIGVRACC